MDLHPATVHLPIALALLWPIVDGIGFLARRRDVSAVGLGLLGAAALASLVATVSGQAAFDAAVAAGHRPEVLTAHADPANLVPWALLLALGARWAGAARLGRAGHLAGIALGFGLWALVYTVGQTGGALVFEHGVGVRAQPAVEASPPTR
jgi:uncharacterized membrane protein